VRKRKSNALNVLTGIDEKQTDKMRQERTRRKRNIHFTSTVSQFIKLDGLQSIREASHNYVDLYDPGCVYRLSKKGRTMDDGMVHELVLP
jgi:hypothetical protein